MLYNILQHFHSGWAYLTLFSGTMFLLIVSFYTFNKRARDKFIKTLGFITILIFHVQMVTGAILYFISPKVQSGNIFYKIEHPITMFTAILLMTIANSKLKKDNTVKLATLILALVAMLLVFGRIPWSDWAK